MAKGKSDKPKKKKKTFSVPFLTYAGAGYGAIYQPIAGGGISYGGTWVGAWETGKNQGFWEGCKYYFQSVLSNYTGIYTFGEKWKWDMEGMKEGWLPFAAGLGGDGIMKRLRVTKFFNKGFKYLKLKLRWVSPW